MVRNSQNKEGYNIESMGTPPVQMMAKSSKTRDQNIATTRVLQVLVEFARKDGALGVTEIGRAMGMTKSMAFRAVATLVDEGYLVKNFNGQKYDLGPKIFDLFNPDAPEYGLDAITKPYMTRMRELTGETVQLCKRFGDRQTVIAGLEGHGRIVVRLKLGSSMPLHASTGSRAILAALPDKMIAEYIDSNAPLEQFTPNTIVDPDLLWREVHEVRERGYAVGRGDYSLVVSSVGFAVMGAGGLPHGAIVVGGPKKHFGTDEDSPLINEIAALIAELNSWTALYDPED